MPKRIEVLMADSGLVTVEFVNDEHFTKRELQRVLRTIQQESRQSVKRYRREQRLKLIKENENGERESEQSRPVESSEQRQEPRPARTEPVSSDSATADRTAESPVGNLTAAIDAKRRRRIEEGPRGGEIGG